MGLNKEFHANHKRNIQPGGFAQNASLATAPLLSWTEQILLLFDLLKHKESEDRTEGSLYTAKQVAHDIRSPVAVLQTLADSNLIPETEKELLIAATNRIRTIADDLLVQKKQEFDPQHFDILAAAHTIQFEKAALHHSVILGIQSSASKLWVKGVEASAIRIFSNLLNNAFESIPSGRDPEVRLEIHETYREVLVHFIDNGKGIPSYLLPRIGKRGFSYGKTSGQGLGLSMAIQQIRSWGGDLQIESEVDDGTTITLRFQKL